MVLVDNFIVLESQNKVMATKENTQPESSKTSSPYPYSLNESGSFASIRNTETDETVVSVGDNIIIQEQSFFDSDKGDTLGVFNIVTSGDVIFCKVEGPSTISRIDALTIDRQQQNGTLEISSY
jgi:hypothetical protein